MTAAELTSPISLDQAESSSGSQVATRLHTQVKGSTHHSWSNYAGNDGSPWRRAVIAFNWFHLAAAAALIAWLWWSHQQFARAKQQLELFWQLPPHAIAQQASNLSLIVQAHGAECVHLRWPGAKDFHSLADHNSLLCLIPVRFFKRGWQEVPTSQLEVRDHLYLWRCQQFTPPAHVLSVTP